VSYAKASGGIYADCGIHDIDMSRWLLGVGKAKAGKKVGGLSIGGNTVSGQSEVTRCYGTGSIVRHPELVEQEDCDNALGIIEFANGSKTTLHLSRTGMGGYSSVVEVFGTEQKLEVGVSFWAKSQGETVSKEQDARAAERKRQKGKKGREGDARVGEGRGR